jgi:peroxiredoxin
MHPLDYLLRLLGKEPMTKILAGHKAPGFALKSTSGQKVSLQEALEKGPVVAAFFKISCPVCQFTFPFLERIYKKYGGDGVTVVGISQDDARDTKEFCAEYGVTFPCLIDERGYPASNAYGLTNVPTVFLIEPDGKVKVSSMGFSKTDLEKIADYLAERKRMSKAPLFLPTEVIPDYKPG